ncbi:MAG: hypothetical protein GY856_44130 [bacterium]|nr:hypothetical protein [bacterium]
MTRNFASYFFSRAAPEGNRYQWLPARGGKAMFELPILGTWTPRVPVHFLLMRGRLEGTAPLPGNRTDLGKPATLGSTKWLKGLPVDNQLTIDLDYPAKALPALPLFVRPGDRFLAGAVGIAQRSTRRAGP